MKKFLTGLAFLSLVGFTPAVFAQEVSPTQDNDVTIQDNQVVTIVCTIIGHQDQDNSSTQVQEIPVPEADAATESDPAVQSVVQSQNLDQKCGDITVIIKSQVNEPTVTPTPTATPTPIVVTNTIEKVTEKVVETPVTKTVVVPQGAPVTGRGGN